MVVGTVRYDFDVTVAHGSLDDRVRAQFSDPGAASDVLHTDRAHMIQFPVNHAWPSA